VPPAGLVGTGPNGALVICDVLEAFKEHAALMCNKRATVVKRNGVDVRGWDTPTTPSFLVSRGMKPLPDQPMREYQANAVASMRDATGIALSGNAKLPCAAGKTMVALSHLAQLETFALILTNSAMASTQWRAQLEQFFTLPDRGVLVLQEGVKFKLDVLLRRRPAVVISTYQLLTSAAAHGEDKDEFLRLLCALPYGLIILDEAQTAVADTFKKVLDIPTMLTLTVSATYMHEDNKIIALANRVGPLLVNIPRLTLVRMGVIPDILRVVVCIQSATGHGDDGGVGDPALVLITLLNLTTQ